MKLFDAHNHLQDERFAGRQAEFWQEAESAGVVAMVVNGSSEEDWNDVATLSRKIPGVIASYGLHPWYVPARSPGWLETLRRHIRENPDAAVGEIGLDRWKPDLPYDDQEDVFLTQWNLAREFNRPASIHCLKAWGRLLELLHEHPAPARGFVLHSYGGPKEMINDFGALGAYFSFPGYYLHERKERQRETFRHVPPDRLLVETDAPDQPLPDDMNHHPLLDAQGHPINHPANLAAVYEGLATSLEKPVEELARQVEENFRRLFFTTRL